jgi:hypothetical protein
MKIIYFLFLFVSTTVFSQEIALLKYSGGGDWYANPTSLPNLIKFCNQNINTKINPKPATVNPGGSELFNYPYIHMTGHGNVIFNNVEVENLNKYLYSGGFLHIDDNYGLDKYVRKEIKKLFPEQELVEIPATHPIFQKPYPFPNGLPKIHEHDNKKPLAFGIFIENKLVLLYTYECDLGDGWEDEEVHNDQNEIREKALKMGANIMNYIFNN